MHDRKSVLQKLEEAGDIKDAEKTYEEAEGAEGATAMELDGQHGGEAEAKGEAEHEVKSPTMEVEPEVQKTEPEVG